MMGSSFAYSKMCYCIIIYGSISALPMLVVQLLLQYSYFAVLNCMISLLEIFYNK